MARPEEGQKAVNNLGSAELVIIAGLLLIPAALVAAIMYAVRRRDRR